VSAREVADVGVVGVGTLGSMLCYHLARRGARVIGFEQFWPGHDRGSGAGESRIFRATDDWSEDYAPISREALGHWRRLEEESGRGLLTLTGVLLLGPERSWFMQRAARTVSVHGLQAHRMTAAELAREYPAHRVGEADGGILEVEAGYLRPELCIWVAADLAERQGAVVKRGERVVRVAGRASGAVIETSAGAYDVGTAVVCAGAWTGRLVPAMREVVSPVRHVSAWFIPKIPEAFSADAFPVFIRDDDRTDLSGFPMIDGVSVKLGVDLVYTGVEDPDHLDRSPRPEETRQVGQVAASWLDGLDCSPCRVSIYQDGYSPDRQPVIGPVPGVPGVYVACGFSGHGFKMAPAIASVVADSLLDRVGWDQGDRFRPGRFEHLAGPGPAAP
jgi:sarcosine oxidase